MAENDAIGIDLGTTYSCVGVWRNGRVEIIPNDQGNRTTPSYVAFTDKKRYIGDAAKNQAAINVRNTVFDAKRLIGRWFSDASVQSDRKLWPFQVVPDDCNKPMIEVQFEGKARQFTPEEISSIVLAKMKEMAEAFLGCEVKKAVVTVPAYFNDSQRQATKQAGIMAGLDVLRIINEPTAAAIAYGLDERGRGTVDHNVLIFDLGGGTLDVSLLRIGRGVIEVKATAGNTHLGGEDLDNRLVDYLVAEFKRKQKQDVSTDARMLRRMRTACERAKRLLSVTTQTTIEIDMVLDDYNCSISRAKFEDLCIDLFRKCLEPVEKCLRDANMDKSRVHEVVLVGGSTRIPKVQQLLGEFFDGKLLNRTINCDEAVAYGAAVLAAKLSGVGSPKVKDLIVRDVTPLSLGVKLIGGVMETVIPRNTTIPTKKQNYVTTVLDNQTSVSLSIYEGESRRTERNNLLGSFELRGLPPAPRGVGIKVSFDMDANGILSVSAVNDDSGAQSKITIMKEKLRASEEHIERLLEQAEKYEEEDEQVLKDIAALLQYIDKMLEPCKLKKNGVDLIEARELEKKEAAENTLLWLDTRNHLSVDELKGKLGELQKLCH